MTNGKIKSGNSVYAKPLGSWLFSRRPKAKPYWEKVPLNVISAERLLAELSAPNSEPWQIFQDHKLYKRLHVFNYANEYAEPGYSLAEGQRGVLFGNWNCLSRAGLDLLEQSYALEWCDEWSTCSDCGKAVRTSPDDMSWSPSYLIDEGGLTCVECLATDPGSYFDRVAWDVENGQPEDSASWSILSHLGVWEEGTELPDGWEILEDRPEFNGDEEKAVNHYFAEGYTKVIPFRTCSYEFKTILGFKGGY